MTQHEAHQAHAGTLDALHLRIELAGHAERSADWQLLAHLLRDAARLAASLAEWDTAEA